LVRIEAHHSTGRADARRATIPVPQPTSKTLSPAFSSARSMSWSAQGVKKIGTK
jgi:hypothetical protein